MPIITQSTSELMDALVQKTKGQIASPGISPMLFFYNVFRFVNVPPSFITNKSCDTVSINLVPRALFPYLGAPRV